MNNIKRKPNGYWNYNRCREEALKYKNKKDFKASSQSCYRISIREGWLVKITSHMIPLGNLNKRLIYSFIFSDNYVYIGLTCNSEKRYYEHLKNENSIVYKHIKKTSLIPEFKILSDYLSIDKAVKLEKDMIIFYKEKSYFILNTRKGGELGSNIKKWSYKTCKEEALKFSSRNEFYKYSKSCYVTSLNNKWFNDITKHMIDKVKPQKYWNLNTCKEEALKYKTRNEFIINESGAYNKARENKWLDDICKHMTEIIKPKGYWTFEKCKEEAGKYNTKSKFNKGCSGAYKIANLNNWLDIFYPKNKLK